MTGCPCARAGCVPAKKRKPNTMAAAQQRRRLLIVIESNDLSGSMTKIINHLGRYIGPNCTEFS
ncbi:MAG: hypothetical protein K8F62_04360 [Pseudorhodoplanes sp.]|nr:hypothetical protein [Pseudorhodoplanes sp.]